MAQDLAQVLVARVRADRTPLLEQVLRPQGLPRVHVPIAVEVRHAQPHSQAHVLMIAAAVPADTVEAAAAVAVALAVAVEAVAVAVVSVAVAAAVAVVASAEDVAIDNLRPHKHPN